MNGQIIRAAGCLAVLLAGFSATALADDADALKQWTGCWEIPAEQLDRLSADVKNDTELDAFRCHERTPMRFCIEDVQLDKKRLDVRVYDLIPRVPAGEKAKPWRLRMIASNNEFERGDGDGQRVFVGEILVTKRDQPVAARLTYEFRCSVRMEMTVDAEGKIVEIVEPILQAAWGSKTRRKWVGLRHVAYAEVSGGSSSSD